MKVLGVFRFRSSHYPLSMLKYSETCINNSCFLALRLTMLDSFCADILYRLIIEDTLLSVSVLASVSVYM